MRSPAAAIAWEFRHRHRWGFIALAGYLLLLVGVKLFFLDPRQPLDWDDVHFALVVVVPLATTFTYLLAVFTYGYSGDLAARESMYPARYCTLPVTTAALVGWPMLYGTAAMAILWLTTRLCAVWPTGVDIPVLWPALLAAVLLAWTQALTWMPYGLRGLRVIVSVLWLAAIDFVVLLALELRAHEPAMMAFLAPQLPLAYLTAYFAVARARRGDVPDWSGIFAWIPAMARARSSQQGNFQSAASAQAWFEWRRAGRSLPVWVAILLPFELALLWVAGDTPALIYSILLFVLLTPPLMASFTAATFGKSNTFVATRPLTSAALVAAKLKATVWSTATAWLLVLAAIPLALSLSHTLPVVVERAIGLRGDIGAPRATVLVLLLVATFIAFTWKQLVQGLYVGLSGRDRLIKGSVFVTLSLLFLIGPVIQWIADHREVRGALWDAVPSILAVLVLLKVSAATWVATRLFRSRLLTDRALVTGAAWWCVAVLALYAVLVWFLSTPIFPRYVLALVAILAIPLARLSAAPLALAWSRHR